LNRAKAYRALGDETKAASDEAKAREPSGGQTLPDEPTNLPAVDSLDGLPVSSYRDWLSQRREDHTKKRPAERALDTFEALASREVIAAAEVAPIIEAARSPYLVAWDIGMEFLCRLAATHQVARDLMWDFMLSRKAELRVRVLGAMHDRLPKEFCLSLVRRGLIDVSKRVRQAAADRCGRFLFREMLADLSRAASVEPDPETKFEIEFATGIVRDGYFIYSRPDGSQAFVVRIADGYPAVLCWPGPAYRTEAGIKERGPRVVAEEIRRVSGRTWRPFRWDT
jgi:hypothetical protein